MRIIGNKNDVNAILLKHKGKDIKFHCYQKPLTYMDRVDLKEDREVEIIFDDLTEVDSLIGILEKFRKESCEYIGEWR